MDQTRDHDPRVATITGVILAGGQGRRLGGRDKGLVPFRQRTLVDWVIGSLKPQVATLLINANRNHLTYAAFGYPVIADDLAGYQGPLAGFASAMAAACTPWILTVPCDGPFVAPDLGMRLCAAIAREGAELAVASDGTRLQPVHALLPVTLAPSLRDFLDSGERKVGRWYARHRVALVDFSDRPGCFVNINSPADADALGEAWAP